MPGRVEAGIDRPDMAGHERAAPLRGAAPSSIGRRGTQPAGDQWLFVVTGFLYGLPWPWVFAA
jgi:hypothetical protein